jgi:hypothetical protein
VQNPYVDGELMCADAEWENRGKAKNEIRLQKFKALDECNGKPAIYLNFVHLESWQSVASPALIAFGSSLLFVAFSSLSTQLPSPCYLNTFFCPLRK